LDRATCLVGKRVGLDRLDARAIDDQRERGGGARAPDEIDRAVAGDRDEPPADRPAVGELRRAFPEREECRLHDLVRARSI